MGSAELLELVESERTKKKWEWMRERVRDCVRENKQKCVKVKVNQIK